MTGFTIGLPEGFIELSATPATAELQRELEELFSLPAGDTSAARVAESLSALGALAAGSGAQYSSIGLFRSPDDPQRPVSVVLTASQMASNHDGAGTVITGLRQVYAADPGTGTEVLQLPAGRALATVREEPLLIKLNGDAPVALLQRQVVAWIPDRAGSAVAVVGVASNCWQDWPHVCDLALEIFDSVAWDDR